MADNSDRVLSKAERRAKRRQDALDESAAKESQDVRQAPGSADQGSKPYSRPRPKNVKIAYLEYRVAVLKKAQYVDQNTYPAQKKGRRNPEVSFKAKRLVAMRDEVATKAEALNKARELNRVARADGGPIPIKKEEIFGPSHYPALKTFKKEEFELNHNRKAEFSKKQTRQIEEEGLAIKVKSRNSRQGRLDYKLARAGFLNGNNGEATNGDDMSSIETMVPEYCYRVFWEEEIWHETLLHRIRPLRERIHHYCAKCDRLRVSERKAFSSHPVRKVQDRVIVKMMYLMRHQCTFFSTQTNYHDTMTNRTLTLTSRPTIQLRMNSRPRPANTQLSGVNGEWTGLDDLAATGGAKLDWSKIARETQVDRDRKRKEAKNHNKQRKTNNRELTERDPNAEPPKPAVCRKHLAGNCTYGDKCKYFHPPLPAQEANYPEEKSDRGQSDAGRNEEEQQPTQSEPVYVLAYQPEEFDGWYDGETGADGEPPARYVTELPGVVIEDVISEGHGFVIQHSKAKHKHKRELRACGFVRALPGVLSSVGLSFPAAEYQVFSPADKVLIKEFPGGEINLALMKAMYACLQKTFPGVPNDWLTNTVRYYTHKRLVSLHEVTQGNMAFMAANGKPASVDITTRNSLIRYNVSDQRSAVEKEFDCECLIQRKWDARSDYVVRRITDEEGYRRTVKLDLRPIRQEDDSLVYPDEFFVNRFIKPGHRTVLCRFVGANQRPFVRYSNSTNNISKALKRLLAARGPEEWGLREKQSYLGILYAKEHGFSTHITQLLEILRVKPDFLGPPADIWEQYKRCLQEEFADDSDHLPETLPELQIGSRPDGTLVDLEPSCPAQFHCMLSKIMDFISDMNDRCTPFFVTRLLDVVKTKGSWVYSAIGVGLLECLPAFESRARDVSIVHAKRRLREEYYNSTPLHLDDDVLIQKIQLRVKMESGKYAKVPRLFADYSKGCIYASYLPAMAKKLIDGEYTFEHYGVLCLLNVYSEPKADGIGSIFQKIIRAANSRDELYCAVYSDDIILGGSIRGRKFAANIDISSCDSSNWWPIFLIAGGLLGNISERRAQGLVEQCCKPMFALNPGNHREKIEVIFSSAFEGSGTVLTTLLNFIASGSGSIAMMYQLIENEIQQTFGSDDVLSLNYAAKQGFAAVGHTVTVEPAMSHGAIERAKLQFLKRSYGLTTKGSYVEFLNYGAIFRNFGVFDGDLEPSSLNMGRDEFNSLNWAQRFEKYARGVVAGLVHEPSSRIMNALRRRFQPTEADEKIFVTNALEQIESDDRSTHELDSLAFLERYSVSEDEVDELVQQIENQCFAGSLLVSSAVAKFYAVDYGVTDLDREPAEYALAPVRVPAAAR